MKWIEQTRIESKVLENPGFALSQLAASYRTEVDLMSATRTEHFSPVREKPIMHFTRYDQTMPKFGPLSNTNFWFPANSQKVQWGFYIGKKNELVISRDRIIEERDKTGIEKEIRAVFLPEDADELLKSLFIQAANLRGRTPVSEILKIIQFKTSGMYEREIARLKKSSA
tara:strand:- start:298 stop:807 length:510 start_codon:yes stop_codon:yes gene_type:complete